VPSAPQARSSVGIDMEQRPRSACDRKLADTPQAALNSRNDRPRSRRSFRRSAPTSFTRVTIVRPDARSSGPSPDRREAGQIRRALWSESSYCRGASRLFPAALQKGWWARLSARSSLSRQPRECGQSTSASGRSWNTASLRPLRCHKMLGRHLGVQETFPQPVWRQI
jgi:hypothetical protein